MILRRLGLVQLINDKPVPVAFEHSLDVKKQGGFYHPAV